MTKLKSILLSGLVAGTLDILAAIFVYSVFLNKVKVITLLQGIASGIFGKSAFEGGIMMAALGLIFHYFIACSFSTAYFISYPILRLRNSNPWIAGMLYGILVWSMMNLVVLPLSNVATTNIKLIPAIRAIIILMICVGLPISHLANRYYHSTK